MNWQIDSCAGFVQLNRPPRSPSIATAGSRALLSAGVELFSSGIDRHVTYPSLGPSLGSSGPVLWVGIHFSIVARDWRPGLGTRDQRDAGCADALGPYQLSTGRLLTCMDWPTTRHSFYRHLPLILAEELDFRLRYIGRAHQSSHPRGRARRNRPMMLSVVWASCTRPNPGRVAGIPSQSPQHLSQVLLRGFRTRTEDLRKGIRRNGPTADEITPKKNIAVCNLTSLLHGTSSRP